jgi:serine/threonine protein phosphatase PrpC
MSTQQFCARKSRNIHTRVLFYIIGGALALLLALSPYSGASASSTAHYLVEPSPQSVARAGVSVVRLVTSYASTNTESIIQCTGLGVLVASWLSQNGGDQNNWILTDGSLLNGSIVQTPGAVTCGPNPPVTARLVSVQISFSATYNQQAPSITLENGLDVNTHCMVAACSGGPALFSFNDAPGALPYIDIATAPVPAARQMGLGLIQSPASSSSNAQLPPPFNDAMRNHLYAQQVGRGYIAPSLVALNKGNIEPGTPIVDNNGNLVGMRLSNNKEASVQDIVALIQQNGASQQDLHANAVHDNWDRGITLYYQQRYADASAAFETAASANPQFQGAKDFMRLAENAAVGTGKGGFTFLGLFLPYWILAIIGLAVLIAILVVASLLFGRGRKRRRAFDAEVDEAEQQAAQEAQRIREMEASERERWAQHPTLVPLDSSNAPAAQNIGKAAPAVTRPIASSAQLCPNCHGPVALGAPFCPRCHTPMVAPAVQNQSGQQSAPQPISQPVPIGSIVDQPTIGLVPSNARKGQSDPERTEPYSRRQLRARPLSLSVVTRTNRGIKRQHKPNEDSLFAALLKRMAGAVPSQIGLFVVADGMGGHANGQDASRLAIQTIINTILPQLMGENGLQGTDFKQLLLDGVQNANKAVHQQNMEQRGDSGTTMTASLVVDTTAYIANVGDSRTYVYRDAEGLQKVTQDHSVVASLVAAGIIKPDDIYTHPKRNQIYRSLGDRPTVEVDPFVVPLQVGDKLLLCTDGLWDMVRDPQIEEVIRNAADDLEHVGDALIQAALDGGGEDNVSIIVAHLTDNVQAVQHGFRLIYMPDSVQLPSLG